MTLERKYRLIRRHSAPVVDDLNQGAPRVLYDDADLGRSGIDGVLHEFLHNGRRPLDDLARGNHIRYITRQYSYIHITRTTTNSIWQSDR